VVERACVDDVAFRVIAANRRPDHCTIARFRQRHEAALAGLFSDVLELCADAGLVGVAVLAVDGTKMHANASQHQNLDFDQIAREILAEADAVDRAEDERFGDRRGDELPAELATAQGRRGWLREAKRRLEDRRAAEAEPIPKARPERLREGKRRLEEDHAVHCRANEVYEAYRARGVMKDGRRFGKPPTPYKPSATPRGKVNVTDPDSRNVKTPGGYMQGYNTQGVCNEHQIVVTAELNTDSPDFGHLEPMVAAAERELTAAGVSEKPQVVVADAGYWHHDQMDDLAGRGITVLVPPDAGKRKGDPAGVGRRPLRVHAQRALNRPRPPALRQTAGDDRAGLRPHQVQSPLRSLLTPRHIGLPVGMA
jgi:DDE family transposase